MARFNEAEKSLCWLRGWVGPSSIKHELEEITAAVKANTWTTSGKCEKISVGFSKFRLPTFYRPFLLVMTCFFIGNFTGVATLSTYAVTIFASLGSPIDRYYATCLLGVAQIAGSLTCAALIHYTGKRPLVIASILGNGVLFAGVACYAYFYAGVYTLDNGITIKTNFPESNPYSWVPLVGLVGGAFCAFCCARLLPWIIIGEIFPADIRGLASGMAASTYYVFGFAANKTYFAFVDNLTVPGVYFLHGGVAVLSAFFYYFFLPETEGWSLHEVEEHFDGKRNLLHAGKKPEVREGRDNLGMSLGDLNKG